MHTCTCTCMHTYTLHLVCQHKQHTYLHTYTYIHTYMRTYIHRVPCVPRLAAYIRTYIHTCIHAYTWHLVCQHKQHTNIHTYIHMVSCMPRIAAPTCIHTHTHTYIHTYIHTYMLPGLLTQAIGFLLFLPLAGPTPNTPLGLPYEEDFGFPRLIWCMYMHAHEQHTCMCVCMYVCICVSSCVYIDYTYRSYTQIIHTHIHTYIHTHIHTCVNVFWFTPFFGVFRVFVYVKIYTCKHIYM
jgi:hypothetical protein